MPVKHALCSSSSFVGSGPEILSQHGPTYILGYNLLFLLIGKILFWYEWHKLIWVLFYECGFILYNVGNTVHVLVLNLKANLSTLNFRWLDPYQFWEQSWELPSFLFYIIENKIILNVHIVYWYLYFCWVAMWHTILVSLIPTWLEITNQVNEKKNYNQKPQSTVGSRLL